MIFMLNWIYTINLILGSPRKYCLRQELASMQFIWGKLSQEREMMGWKETEKLESLCKGASWGSVPL